MDKSIKTTRISQTILDPNSTDDKHALDHLINKKETKKKIPKKKKEKKAPTRPRGRPKIWTKERIAQLKAEKKAKADKKRKEKSIIERDGKLDINHPLSNYEQKKVINQVIQTKLEIEQKISKIRKTFNSINLFSINECECEHLYSYCYVEGPRVVVCCKKCSRQDKLSFHDYLVHVRENKEKL